MKRFLYISLFILLVVYAFLAFFHTDGAITEDLGRHILLGKIIVTEKTVPNTNLFSYTYPDFPFINHHWGSEVIFYLVYRLGSINGLIMLKVGILLSVLFFLIYSSIKKIHFPVFILGSSILALNILQYRSDIRPEIFGYLFFVLFLIILYGQKEKKNHRIWFLPLILILWVNLHISFIFGICLYLMYMIDRFIWKRLNRTEVILLFILSGTVCINPDGIQGALYRVSYLTNIFSKGAFLVVENQSLFSLEKISPIPTFLIIKICFVLVLLLSIPSFLKKKFFEIITPIFFGILSLMTIRNVPFFAFSFIYPLAWGLDFYYDQIGKVSAYAHRKYFVLFEISAIFFLIIISIQSSHSLLSNTYYVHAYSGVKTGLGQVKGAREGVDFFITHHLKGPIFNNYDIGSYLIYRLYPQQKVFVDTRPEAYPLNFFSSEYIPILLDDGKWGQEITKRKFQTIIFSHTDLSQWGQLFIRKRLIDPDWEMVYFDHYIFILVRKDDKEYTSLHLDSQEKISQYVQPLLLQYNNPIDLENIGRFLETLGLKKLANTAYTRISQMK
jgi:hypothetical protein